MNDEKRHVLVSDLKYDQDEVDSVVEVLKSEWLTMGPKTIEFEKALFVASANVVLYIGAKPVFADVSPTTFNIDPDSIRKVVTEKTVAILPVHIAGLPAEMDQIMGIAKDHSLRVLDDIEERILGQFLTYLLSAFSQTRTSQ